jgi:branched-chain amino acid transport system substrate-binding protein
MSRKLVALTAAALVLAGVQAAHAQLKVGITACASGPAAVLGVPEMKAVATLPKEIAGQTVTYIALDDKSDPTKGAQNARKLVAEDNVDVLMGSSLTSVSLPLIDIAAESKTPLMTMAASAALVTPMDDKKKWVYKVVPNDTIMAKAILNYIAKTGAKTLGYIGVSDAYGEGYYKELSELAPKLGITLTTHEVYARTDDSVTGQVLKILAGKPDAVFIASSGSPGVLPQKALRERGYGGPIYQTHGIASEDFIKLGGKVVEGAIFAGEAFTVADDLPANNPFRQPTTDFIKKYREANGPPPPIFAAHPYDSMVLISRAMPAALKAGKPSTPEFRAALRDEIEKGKDIYLNNGLSNITPTDHSGYDERSAFIIKIDGGAFRLVK